MKIIALGDTHGNPLWKSIVNVEKDADLFVFIADYFDSFLYSLEEQINNFKDIIQFKKDNMDKVILLVGNHDEHYITRYSGTSGYQPLGEHLIKPLFLHDIDLFQLTYKIDNLLFSHAGISPEFMDDVFGAKGWNEDNIVDLLNNKFKYQPLFVKFNSEGKTKRYVDYSGDDTHQSPVWIRPFSLQKANRRNKMLYDKYIQIIGHTQQKKLLVDQHDLGGKYIFIDTINTSGEYLEIIDGEFKAKNI